MSLEEADVAHALDSLRFKQLALTSAEGSRVQKYRHALMEKLRLDPAELAILGELLLRGPQTVGELRSRAERMHPFADLAAVEDAMKELMERTPPLITRLPREPGRKEHRFIHLFADIAEPAGEEHAWQQKTAVPMSVADNDRIAILEAEIASLRAEFADLRKIVEEFKSQFE